MELPYDICKAVLCVIEEGLEIVLPVGSGVSYCVREARRGFGCRGHGDGWLGRKGGREKGRREENRARPPPGSSGGDGNGQGRVEEKRKQDENGKRKRKKTGRRARRRRRRRRRGGRRRGYRVKSTAPATRAATPPTLVNPPTDPLLALVRHEALACSSSHSAFHPALPFFPRIYILSIPSTRLDYVLQAARTPPTMPPM